jgi:UDP-N-acetylmuramyl pentapeptide phosphotransferase/UDP-N-acetylglucosamine-1-phosphate transferase
MQALIITFLSSAIIILLLIRYQHVHFNWSGDSELNGPQKFHLVAVPRIGGIGIFLAIAALTLINAFQGNQYWQPLSLLLIAGLPAFLSGLVEDVTKKVNLWLRLSSCAASALIAGYFFQFWILDVRITQINLILSIYPFAIVFTCFAIAGLSNAYNIIDGFNGLTSMIGIIALLSIAYVAYRSNDMLVVHLCIAMTGALLGFFLWNYPRGLIFLGDGGAYLAGFWVACLTLLLIYRNPSVSPWFGLLINIYPVFETIFSIWRRTINKGRHPGVPDGVHFHSLVYRRIVKWAGVNKNNIGDESLNANAKTSPYLWMMSSLGTIPALLWWKSTVTLVICVLIFIATYISLYRSLVRFRKPSWLNK